MPQGIQTRDNRAFQTLRGDTASWPGLEHAGSRPGLHEDVQTKCWVQARGRGGGVVVAWPRTAALTPRRDAAQCLDMHSVEGPAASVTHLRLDK